MTIVTRIFILLFPIILTSCSSLSMPSAMQNRNKHYLSARSIPPLRIPPGISSDAFRNDYPVSERQYPESAKNISLVPPGLMNNE